MRKNTSGYHCQSYIDNQKTWYTRHCGKRNIFCCFLCIFSIPENIIITISRVDQKQRSKHKSFKSTSKHFFTGKIKDRLSDLCKSKNNIQHHCYQKDCRQYFTDFCKNIHSKKIQHKQDKNTYDCNCLNCNIRKKIIDIQSQRQSKRTIQNRCYQFRVGNQSTGTNTRKISHNRIWTSGHSHGSPQNNIWEHHKESHNNCC